MAGVGSHRSSVTASEGIYKSAPALRKKYSKPEPKEIDRDDISVLQSADHIMTLKVLGLI